MLNTKLLSTREQFEAKCKHMELLDAVNFDLEQELAMQRRDNDKNRQQIKELDISFSPLEPFSPLVY